MIFSKFLGGKMEDLITSVGGGGGGGAGAAPAQDASPAADAGAKEKKEEKEEDADLGGAMDMFGVCGRGRGEQVDVGEISGCMGDVVRRSGRPLVVSAVCAHLKAKSTPYVSIFHDDRNFLNTAGRRRLLKRCGRV